MDIKSIPTTSEINGLFDNIDPAVVWIKATAIIGRISPAYDYALVQPVYEDVMRLFRGEYPGYTAIKTLYHDMSHTLDVFLCAIRLMHGVHVSGTRLSDRDITLVMIATLMHDIGYAQLQNEASGSGAQHTPTHVKRGIAFMRHYLAERHFPADWAASLAPMMDSTDLALKFPEIVFPDERSRMLGKIVGTADLTGQMADRTYLEKLLFLYLEFREANFGNYQSTYDMLCRTSDFYSSIRERLDSAFNGMCAYLAFHFRESMGVERNFYLEAIEKNMAYLSKVVTLNEAEFLSMLKRGGIVERSRAIANAA